MSNENSVIFKGRRGGLIVALDDKTDFGEIKETLRKKLVEAHKFFKNTNASILFRGRDLTDEEEDELISIIAEVSGISISYTNNDGKRVFTPSVAELEAKNPENSENSAKTEAIAQTLNLTQHMAKFHSSSLRSGQSIRFSGSVVVLGDVNPGAEIIAEGNIIILGTLKGLAHAGCCGNNECFVSAYVMSPTQLRIAGYITYIPSDKPRSKRKPLNPSYAYVQDDHICISALF